MTEALFERFCEQENKFTKSLHGEKAETIVRRKKKFIIYTDFSPDFPARKKEKIKNSADKGSAERGFLTLCSVKRARKTEKSGHTSLFKAGNLKFFRRNAHFDFEYLGKLSIVFVAALKRDFL